MVKDFYNEKLERVGKLPVDNKVHLYTYALLEGLTSDEAKALHEQLNSICIKLTKKERALEQNVLAFKIEELLEPKGYREDISSLQAYAILDLLKSIISK